MSICDIFLLSKIWLFPEVISCSRILDSSHCMRFLKLEIYLSIYSMLFKLAWTTKLDWNELLSTELPFTVIDAPP